MYARSENNVFKADDNAQLEFIGFSRYDGIRGIYEELMWRERYYWCLLHAMEVDKIAD